MHIIIIIAITLIAYILISNRSKSTQNKNSNQSQELIALDLRTVEKSIAEKSEDSFMFAIVFVKSNPDLSIDNICHCIEKKWPEFSPVEQILSEGQTRKVKMNGATVIFEITQNYHEREVLTKALKHNSIWPEAESEIANHAVTIVVKVTTNGAGIAHSITLSRALYALTSNCEQVTGILWPTAQHIFSRKTALREFSKNFDTELPFKLWISSNAYLDDSGRTVGFTQGLRAFGAEEVEAINAPETPDALRKRLNDFAAYSVVNSCQIFNGDTIGNDESEKIVLKKLPSETVHTGWVFQLHYINNR